MVQWNALYLIRTSNQWFHHHKELTNMYNNGAGTFVCLELLVRVMLWMPSMEGRTCCCCSSPNQIKVVRPYNPSIYNQVFASTVDTAAEKNRAENGMEEEDLQMVMGKKEDR